MRKVKENRVFGRRGTGVLRTHGTVSTRLLFALSEEVCLTKSIPFSVCCRKPYSMVSLIWPEKEARIAPKSASQYFQELKEAFSS